MAEFAANNNISTFIKLSLFFTSKSLHSYMNFDIVDLSEIITLSGSTKEKL